MTYPMTLASRLDTTDLAPTPLPDGWHVRPCTESDAGELASIYFGAYEPGVASASLEEATDDIEACFRGEYGDLWREASLLAETEGEIGAAVLTVRRAPWPDVPDCPFVIEVFTAPDHRRLGLARHLMIRSMRLARQAGERTVSLRVLSTNGPARRLYESLGFRPWTPPGRSVPTRSTDELGSAGPYVRENDT